MAVSLYIHKYETERKVHKMFVCMSKKTLGVASCVVLLTAIGVLAQNNDRFWYGPTQGNLFGPNDWNQVSCDNIDVCVSIFIKSCKFNSSGCATPSPKNEPFFLQSDFFFF